MQIADQINQLLDRPTQPVELPDDQGVAFAQHFERLEKPKAMNEQAIKQAEALLKDTENYPLIGDVIDQLGIGRTAFYRYFPTDRIKERRNEHSAKA